MIELLSSIIAQYPFFAYNILFVFKKVHLKKKKKEDSSLLSSFYCSTW